MDTRTFDLSIPVSRLLLVGWSAFGLIQIACGFFALERGDDIFGGVQIAFGLFFLLFVVLMPRANRYVIRLEDAYLGIERGLSRTRTIPWESVSELHIQLLKVDIVLKRGKSVTWNFKLSFTDNQIVKPQIIAALTEFAAAKGIPVRDSRS